MLSVIPSVDSAQLTDTKREKRLDIQGLRAIAVLTVVAFHASLPVPGGFVGVDIFFVISGFVITAMLQSEWAATGRIRFARFYIRRFKRLIPALAVLVAVTVAISTLVLSPFGTQQVAANTGIGAMLFVANAVIAKITGGYFDAPAETNPLLNTWSLSVEEQFYFAFPLALASGWLLSKRTRCPNLFPFVVVACVAAASFMLAVLGAANPRGSALLGFYSPLTRAWEFALGALLVLSATKGAEISRTVATAVGTLGALMVAASLFLITRTTIFPGVWTLLPVIGTVLLILAGANQSNPVSRALATRPMVSIGDWSYSIYLWHWPFIVFAAIIWPDNPWAVGTAAALSLLPALASYRWVEQPIRMQSLSRPRFGMLVTVTLAIPLLFAAGLWQGARTFFWTESPAIIAAKTELPTGWGSPLCVSRIPVHKRDTSGCQWFTDAPGGPIYLVGDSNAMHFSDAVKNAAADLRRPMTALGIDGCPLIDVLLWRKNDPSFMTECREAYIALMRRLTMSPPGLVLVGSVDRYWRDTSDYRVSIDGSVTDANFDLNTSRINDGLQRTVQALQRAGHAVLLLQTIPHYLVEPYTLGANCSGLGILSGRCTFTAEMPIEVADKLHKTSRLGINRVAQATGASVLDFRPYFCQASKFLTRINGVDHYMPDGYHLNKSGSLLLTETFIMTMRKSP